MKERHATLVWAVVLLGMLMASDAFARGASRSGGHGGGHSSGHGGGHSGGHAAGGSGRHFSGGGYYGRAYVAPVRFVPRAVFIAAPVAYYYAAPPAYSYPPAYYEPVPPPAYYEPPVQSYPPPASFRPLPDASEVPPPPRGPYAAQDALRYRFFCPDSRKYYPEVNTCAMAWLKVVPDGIAASR